MKINLEHKEWKKEIMTLSNRFIYWTKKLSNLIFTNQPIEWDKVNDILSMYTYYKENPIESKEISDNMEDRFYLFIELIECVNGNAKKYTYDMIILKLLMKHKLYHLIEEQSFCFYFYHYCKTSKLLTEYLFKYKPDLNQWFILLKNDIVILKDFVIRKISKLLKNHPDPLEYLENLRPYVWFDNYNQLHNSLIRQKILLLHELKPTIKRNHYFLKAYGIETLLEDQYGFKALYTYVKGEKIPCVAKLLLPIGTRIVIPNKSNKLRCDQYMIESIYLKDGSTIQSAKSPIKRTFYSIGKLYKEENMSTDVNTTCGTGLHFFANFNDVIESIYMY